jgi:hypothetical protein
MFILNVQEVANKNQLCRDWLQSSKFRPVLEQAELICSPEAIEIHCRSEAVCAFLTWNARYLLSEINQLGYQKFALFRLGAKTLMTKNIIPEASMPHNVEQDMEILGRLMYADRSGALVNNLNGKMIMANQYISDTAGKPLTEGKKLNNMWPKGALEKLLAYLAQDKNLREYQYQAYGWKLEDGIWVRELKKFCGDFELVTFQGKPCRLSSVVTL